MNLITAPSGHRLLLIWRTEFLFYTPERRRLAREWNQVRLASSALEKTPGALNHGLDQPLPFRNESFDAIYCFHVIEHLSLGAGKRFLQDLHRLLKPGGTCRISTPDLEFHAREYLACLAAQLASPGRDHYARYQWALCNLVDQCTRQVSGGEMLGLIERDEIDAGYVKYMNGDLLRFLFPPACPPPSEPSRRITVSQRSVRFLRRWGRAVYRRVVPVKPSKSYLELTREKNLWLFDRVSLDRILSGSGFRNIAATDHRISSIPGWDRYNFDQSALGSYPLEPSLYIEATK